MPQMPVTCTEEQIVDVLSPQSQEDIVGVTIVVRKSALVEPSREELVKNVQIMDATVLDVPVRQCQDDNVNVSARALF